MKRLIALMMCAVSFGAAAQSTITYPYNPDGNADALIGVTDLQDMLSTYGGAFYPSEILVEGETLTTVLTQLQNSIDSLSGLTGGGGSVLDMPLGTVLPIATESVPEGWMLCDGREISIEEYQGLYDLIGTTFGAGDSAFWAQVFYPATTFNIPDLRGRTIIGANNMGGEQSDILAIHQAAIGQIGGEEMHLLIEEEMPTHSHFNDHSGHLVEGYNTEHIYEYDSNFGTAEFMFVTSINETVGPDSRGNDIPHNNMQPYMALNFMIKVESAEDVIAGLENRIAEIEESISEEDTLVVDISNACYSCCTGVLINVDAPIIKFIGDSSTSGSCYYQFSPPTEDISEILVLNASEKTVRGFVGGSYLNNHHWVTLKGVDGQWYLPWDRE